MINHQLPQNNLIAKIDKVPFSPSVFKKYSSKKIPVIFTNITTDWPASKLWNLDYLSNKAGKRKIYVKNIRKNKKFISNFDDALKTIYQQSLQNNIDPIVIQMAQIITGKIFSRGNPCLTELKNDIILPSIIPSTRIVEVNFWAGSGDNITELHYDPTDNFLSIIKGEKNIVIFPPNETEKLYNVPSSVTKKSVTHSAVDIKNIDVLRYPKIFKAKYFECSLKEGETLFLPCGFWHVVESIGINMAVNIWWLPKILDFFKQPSNKFWKEELISRILRKKTCVPHSIDQLQD